MKERTPGPTAVLVDELDLPGILQSSHAQQVRGYSAEPRLGSFCQNEEVDSGDPPTFSSTNSTSGVFFRAATLDE
jgi:hypothetical protein